MCACELLQVGDEPSQTSSFVGVIVKMPWSDAFFGMTRTVLRPLLGNCVSSGWRMMSNWSVTSVGMSVGSVRLVILSVGASSLWLSLLIGP